MTLRGRLSFAAAVAVAIAVISAGAVAYMVVRGELLRQVDQTLLSRAANLSTLQIERTARGLELLPPPPLGAPGGHTQLVYESGLVVSAQGAPVIPVTARARKVASGEHGSFFATQRAGGMRVRVVTLPYTNGIALQVARPMDELEHVLSRTRWLLLVVVLAGVALAAALGELVSRSALGPVDRLTRAAETVAQTRDPSMRIDEEGTDELSRLAGAFNTMLGALDESLRAQRRLVADASHELRTPLTSLRTNIEVLARTDALAADDREKLLRDVLSQIDALTALVGDLVDLARGDDEHPAREDVRLDHLVELCVEQARTNWSSVRFTVTTEPTTVPGIRARLQRAVVNLLDNAAKFSGDGASVEVTVARGSVAVRDHGSGIADDDLPHIFDRFYRASTARALPGSGLGLAIVRQVAASHGGTVSAENCEDGGSLFRLSVPELD